MNCVLMLPYVYMASWICSCRSNCNYRVQLGAFSSMAKARAYVTDICCGKDVVYYIEPVAVDMTEDEDGNTVYLSDEPPAESIRILNGKICPPGKFNREAPTRQ